MQPASPNSPIAAEPHPQILPEFWPCHPVGTVRPIWIPWPIALLLAPLFWLMPKRFGPHFAAASCTAGIASFLAWGIYGATSLYVAILAPRHTLVSWLLGRTPEQQGQSLMPVPTLGEILRGPLALLVRTTGELGGVLLAVVLVLLGLLVLSSLLMPFIAAGEPSRRLLARTFRLTLWAFTSLIVLALAIQTLLAYDKDALDALPVRLAIALYSAWAVSLVLRGGARYAGPATGPAWEPQSPLCTTCGYALTSLPASGICPECGRAVAESLPDYRQPSPFAAATSFLGRIRAFPGTYWRALRGRGFYERLATREGSAAARRFVVWNSVVTGVVLAVFLVFGIGLHEWSAGRPAGPHWNDLLGTLMVAAWTALGLLGFVGLAALVSSRFGWRPLQRRAIGVFYWSVWLLPLGVGLIVTFTSMDCLVERLCLQSNVSNGPFDLRWASVLSLLIIPLCILWRALVHLSRAIRGIRYANA